MSDCAGRAVTSVERLLRTLAEVVDKAAIADWMETPNEAFGQLKPVEVLEAEKPTGSGGWFTFWGRARSVDDLPLMLIGDP